jgi:transcriptional regulator with XRE-family HTH domain
MAGSPALDPTVVRRRLRKELQKARETAGMTQPEVAEAMDWSISKLIRIESGQVGISTNDLRALLGHYGIIDDAKVTDFINSAKASRERSWWNEYRDVASTEYLTFLGHESSASRIRCFEPIVIPGLLQTEDYAREVINSYPGRSSKDVARLVELRMFRQDRILRDDGPNMYFVLDEAAIYRIVGSPHLMVTQLNHLMVLNKQPNIEILILPFKEGLHALSRTSMVHFTFEGLEVEDVLYLEGPGPTKDLIVGESESAESDISPSKFLDLFWTIEHTARHYDTISLIQEAVGRLSKEGAIEGNSAKG